MTKRRDCIESLSKNYQFINPLKLASLSCSNAQLERRVNHSPRSRSGSGNGFGLRSASAGNPAEFPTVISERPSIGPGPRRRTKSAPSLAGTSPFDESNAARRLCDEQAVNCLQCRVNPMKYESSHALMGATAITSAEASGRWSIRHDLIANTIDP